MFIILFHWFNLILILFFNRTVKSSETFELPPAKKFLHIKNMRDKPPLIEHNR